MLKSEEVRRQVAQRLRELLPKAKGWQESADTKIGGQIADLLAKFQLAGQEHTLVVEVSSLGQPRQIRAAVTRLNEIRRELPGAHPVAAAIYIGPQSARILKSNNLGFVDLSGNCYLAFENVLIEKEGKRNVRPSTRPLRSLFAPRATRVVRVLLIEPGRAWRLEELGKAAAVSLGHSQVHGRGRPRRGRRRAPVSLHAQRGRRAPGAESQAASRALLPRGRSRAGRPGARVAPGGRDRRNTPFPRALRPGRAAWRLREGRAQGRVPAPALRRPHALRAPRVGAGRTSAARGHGLLSDRGRR